MTPHPNNGAQIKPTMVDVPGVNLEPNEEVSGYKLEICDESRTVRNVVEFYGSFWGAFGSMGHVSDMLCYIKHLYG